MTSEKISILITVALVHAVEVIPVHPFGAVKAAGQPIWGQLKVQLNCKQADVSARQIRANRNRTMPNKLKSCLIALLQSTT